METISVETHASGFQFAIWGETKGLEDTIAKRTKGNHENYISPENTKKDADVKKGEVEKYDNSNEIFTRGDQ